MLNYYFVFLLVILPLAAIIESAIGEAQVRETKPDLSRLMPAERESIEMACLQKKILEGPAVYYQCLRMQLNKLSNAPQRPDLSRLSPQERESIEMVCLQTKVLEGPASYNSCLRSHFNALLAAQRTPDLSKLTNEEKQSIEMTCLQSKILHGPVAYNTCLQQQLGTLSQSHPKSLPSVSSDTSKSKTFTNSGIGGIETKPKHRDAIPTDMNAGNPEADKNQSTSQKPIAKPFKRIGSGCDETFISDIRHEGAIVATGDGHLFEIDEVDRIDSSLWLVADDLLVCWETYIYEGNQVTLYTLRNGGDKVNANRIR
jgi:hypothetical protein